MLHRKVVDLGLPVGVVYPLLVVLFVGASVYLFSALAYAEHIYVAVATSLIAALSEPKRNEFLQTVYSQNAYRLLRSVENLLYALPFLIVLGFECQLLSILMLGVLAVSLALVRFKITGRRAFPTPFGKHPFEFIVGFRKLFLALPALYLFTAIAAREANFGIAVVALLVLTFLCISFYAKPEPDLYVWMHNRSPKQFLWEKVKRGSIQFCVLAAPMFVCTGAFFPNELLLLLGFWILCLGYLAAFILGKYAAFPRELSVPQGVLLAISLAFPPLLLAVIPHFYKRSIENIKPLLA